MARWRATGRNDETCVVSEMLKPLAASCPPLPQFPLGRYAVLFAFIGSLLGQAAQACTVPVFRYALDNWSPDAYRLEVSAADAKDEAVAQFLRNLGTSSPYNIQGIRLQKDEGGQSRLMFPPGKEGLIAEVWHGGLNADALAEFVQSPARKKLVEQMLGGATAVWVFVESGDKPADDAAVAKIEKRLRYLETITQLPAIDPTDPSSKLGPGPKLQVKFGLLRVAATDAAEKIFLKMLAGAKTPDRSQKGAWLAAVFGRGRVLGAWPANGFGDEQVEEVCVFLLGACSCQVKNLNPGWDILLSVDWDAGLQAADKLAKAEGNSETKAEPLEKLAQPETVKIEGMPTLTSSAPAVAANEVAGKLSGQNPVNWSLVATAGMLLVAGACLWFGAQSRR